MINFRSVNFILVLLTSIAVFLSFFRIFNLQLLDVAAYSALFWGIYFLYSSYLRQYKTGITIGSILFLTGSIIFVITKFEIVNFGSVFVPSLLIIISAGLIIANMLTKANSIALLFSLLGLIAGVLLMIVRSSINVDLFLSSVYTLSMSYWVVILISAGVIFLAAKSFKRNDDDQY